MTDSPLGKTMTRYDFDDICPHCGCPLPLSKRPDICPECGYDFLTDTAPMPRTYLTVFGYGVCGLIVGIFAGAAWALTLPAPWQQPMMVLLPMGLGLIGALVAGQTGKHLDPAFHHSYELWLLSADAGALAATLAALVGTTGGTPLGVGIVVAFISRRVFTRLSQLDRLRQDHRLLHDRD